MNRYRVIALLMVIFIGMLLAGIVFAHTGFGFDLSWNVLSGGGGIGTISGSGYSVNSTVGQTIIGVSSGGDDVIEHGFWYSHIPQIYLPIIMK